MVTGHFPLCTTELLGGAFTTFTVLRDPVERTLSYLRHHRKIDARRSRTRRSRRSTRTRSVRAAAQPHGEDASLDADEMTDGA